MLIWSERSRWAATIRAYASGACSSRMVSIVAATPARTLNLSVVSPGGV
jgi:hypothetical protein